MVQPVELSFVIPVFNGSRTIEDIVRRIHLEYRDLAIEVVLVNDGSQDDTEQTCAALLETFPTTVTFVHLARNFGEHSAVLAGLNHSRGAYVAVLDDDGQNPPEEARRLFDAIRGRGDDVVYGRYRVKRHSRLRNLGSWFNDRAANFMLNKPRDLYLSSFKIMNRFLVDEITQYKGAFPYIDGLILRTTRSIGQVEVDHLQSPLTSGYTLRKLISLWLNMFLNFSMIPLRVAALLGLATSVVSVFLLIAVVVDKLYINPELLVGIPTILVTIVFFAGIQLVILGTIGEYLGRLFLDQTKRPQFVVRYVRRGHDAA
jgi:glycosyltransferase involved in cell wall biosynthesis